MVSKTRARRIADRIFEELSLILLNDIKDPRLVNVSITGVRVDKELAFADVYISSFEGSKVSSPILDGLQHANGYLRKTLAERIQLRSFPRLRFHWDPNPEHADKITRLIAEIHAAEKAKKSDAQSDDDTGNN